MAEVEKSIFSSIITILLFQKIYIHTPPMEGFFGLNPSPLWKFQLSPIPISFQILAFEIPHPLGTSVDLPWGGYGYFLELHIILPVCNLKIQKSMYKNMN